jgi:hypothetical protein
MSRLEQWSPDRISDFVGLARGSNNIIDRRKAVKSRQHGSMKFMRG